MHISITQSIEPNLNVMFTTIWLSTKEPRTFIEESLSFEWMTLEEPDLHMQINENDYLIYFKTQLKLEQTM